MKIQELRQLLCSADRTCLEKAFAECYKQVPKAKKEDMDPLIVSLLQGIETKPVKKEEFVDFETLEIEIREFLNNVYAGNYIAPNRIVPKSVRSKWRFAVKGYIKKLQNFRTDQDNYNKAVNLLKEIYQMLCRGCNYYLFSTDNPFSSVGWKQQDLFGIVARMTFDTGYSAENISEMIVLACTGGLSYDALHEIQILELIGLLKTSEVRQLAIAEAKKLVDQKLSQIMQPKRSSASKYEYEDAVNQICGLIFLLYIEQGELEKGLRYYFSNSQEDNKEIVLYCALNLAEWADAGDDVWLNIYRYGLKRKINPREELVRAYENHLQQFADGDTQERMTK